MSIYETIKNYQQGFSIYDICHQQNLNIQWRAFREEWVEFRETPSWDEFWDICHSFGRVIYRTTKLPVQLLALPTVIKHGKRFQLTGCVRSKRNCRGKCCCMENN